jgi:hypothetical protein
MSSALGIRIIIVQPLPGVLYGLQKGGGSKYETIQGQLAKAADLAFTCTISLKGDGEKYDLPDFGGQFVHGPKGARFLYIDIGKNAGQANTTWSRRLKIPLSGITWDTVRQMADHPDLVLSTKVAGIGKDGGPNCATVKPFEGWSLEKMV